MTNVIVVGAQWGDEGKAKVVDLLAESADVVVRCQGGCNAGHTVTYKGDVFKFHLVPSGLLYGNKLCVVGPGTVIDPSVILSEIESFQARGYSSDNLKISDRAHVTLPFHRQLDVAQEKQLSSKKIGTTGKGIGPTYMDKVGRFGVRIGDLYEAPEVLKHQLEKAIERKAPLFDALGVDRPSVAETLAWCQQYAEALKPYVTDTVPMVHKALKQDKQVLFEGAQGTLLDVDFGTYPYVTSSNATAGGACTGSGIGPSKIDATIGVMKAYTTRVGEGPFPTELDCETGNHLQTVGQEFGTTTGRVRRCGWFDAVMGQYSCWVNGLDMVALTKLDVLDGLDEVKICTGYKHKQTGELLESFPSQIARLNDIEPVYETMPGWVGQSVNEARSFEALPEQAKAFIRRIEQLLETPVGMISVGPDRDETMILTHPFAAQGQKAGEPLPC